MATTTQPAPTQTRHPWRATARSVFQAVIALASLAPTVMAVGGMEQLSATPAVGQFILVCGIVTRVMALESVNNFLRRFLPFLATDPKAQEPQWR